MDWPASCIAGGVSDAPTPRSYRPAPTMGREGAIMPKLISKLVAVAALILGAALALFGAQNQDRVALHFLWFSSRPLPASLAILAAALLGVLIGVLLMLPGRIVIGHTARGLRRDVARRDEQVARVSASTPTAEIVRTEEIEDTLPEEARR